MILNVPVEIYALIIAVLIDLFFGDPPNKWHPTAWIGLSIRRLKFLSPSSNYVQFIYGVFLFLIIIIFWAGTTYLLNYYIQSLNYILYVLIIGLFLKSTFSIRMLHKEASKIKTLLEQDDLDQVRLEMPALVSRDTSNLTSQQSLAATIESVSENVTDSFTGPMIAFAFFGLPGAVAYRVVNTLDSMIGYRGEYEYLGKFSAKIDDLLNFIPARLSACTLLISSIFLSELDAKNAWHIMWRDHANTASPNAGWTMSVIAGALNIALEKDTQYKLGDEQRLIVVEDINRTVKAMYCSAVLTMICAVSLILILH
ncbi:MAG: cobalamin biosynthesis protein [Dehalococcoidia bacterium]|nr:cobalamin biosynthesis protein [Dehalococcoidia bacterium]